MASGDLAVISGFSTTDKIDVTGISPTGATLSFASSGGNEVVTVSGTGGSESFVFSDPSQYNANTMALASTGTAASIWCSRPTPVVAFTSLNNLQTNQATYVVNGTVNDGGPGGDRNDGFDLRGVDRRRNGRRRRQRLLERQSRFHQ